MMWEIFKRSGLHLWLLKQMNIGITAHKQIYHVHAIERIDLFVCGEQAPNRQNWSPQRNVPDKRSRESVQYCSRIPLQIWILQNQYTWQTFLANIWVYTVIRTPVWQKMSMTKECNWWIMEPNYDRREWMWICFFNSQVSVNVSVFVRLVTFCWEYSARIPVHIDNISGYILIIYIMTVASCGMITI